ncbi:hypothetical protein FKM82_019599 [Ascaphus truei]
MHIARSYYSQGPVPSRFSTLYRAPYLRAPCCVSAMCLVCYCIYIYVPIQPHLFYLLLIIKCFNNPIFLVNK